MNFPSVLPLLCAPINYPQPCRQQHHNGKATEKAGQVLKGYFTIQMGDNPLEETIRKASTGNVVFIGSCHDKISFPERIFHAVIKYGKLPIKDYILLATWTLVGEILAAMCRLGNLSFKRGRTIY